MFRNQSTCDHIQLSTHSCPRPGELGVVFVRGLTATCRDDGAHALTYELGWRKLEDPSRHASRAVRLQAGHSVKSSLAYTCRYETFADPLLPYDGFGVRCACWRAGMPPALHDHSTHVQALIPHSCCQHLSARILSSSGDVPSCLKLHTAFVQVYDRACRHRAGREAPPVCQAAFAGGLRLATGWLSRILSWCEAREGNCTDRRPPETVVLVAVMNCHGFPRAQWAQVRRRAGCCRGVRGG